MGEVAGVSASRFPLPGPQAAEFLRRIGIECGGELHHGDCVGGDTVAHDFGVRHGFRIIIHPPKKDDFRAFNKIHNIDSAILEPKEYFARNRDIVLVSNVLIAAPAGPEDRAGGGTWYTVHYAKGKIPVYIVYPDGRVEERLP